ncbi:RNA polymerase sigma factor [uncultured Alistipes sp.]|jgi:RNA polymerase sigma-70 factor|uniref:RNA polymerase sigma factor n=1 Tax=uncultured Alistipes sp. TaxID=538949 RepID=UPI0025E7DE33|nr:RNA polymerase sigma-70 factor [uncultured Alistipes sp.]
MDNLLQDNRDRELFQQIRKGSEEAFREVYWHYHKILYSVALKMLKNHSAAENAVQHVFVKLWDCRLDMTVMFSLKNYLYTMTRNYILNYLRSRNTELMHNYRMAQAAPEAADTLNTQIEREDLSRVLDAAIANLPHQKRQVLHLRRAGYSNPEIAQMLNLSVNTVRSHYQEGVKLLKSHFGRFITLLIVVLQSIHS